MSKLALILMMLFAFNVQAQTIETDKLRLTDEQNQRLSEMKENMKAEVEPIWEEIQASKERVWEIEKKYFEEFWKMLTDEQKKEFTKLKNK